MSTASTRNQNPDIMWLSETGPDTQTRLFRRTFQAKGKVTQARIRLFAEAKYLLYVNGKFVDRGPCFHHPMIAPFDEIDLSEHLVEGDNVIAVLVQAINMGLHNHVPSGQPGLCVQMDWTDQTGDHQITADEQWRISDQTGWQWPAPKRTWAIGPIEIYDMANAQHGWQNPGFDDRHWQPPQLSKLGSTVPGGVQSIPRPTPTLGYQWFGLDIHSISEIQITDEPIADIQPEKSAEEHSKRLEHLSTINVSDEITCEQDPTDPHAMQINGLTADRGMVLHLDLGAMHVGQILLDATCPSEGVIDIAWCEAKADGNVSFSRKGACYADRIIACKGELNWRPITFSGMRYVTLIFRGFTGNLHIHRTGIHASIPDIRWNTDFKTSDNLLNDIHAICQRTLCVGSQESLMDCPTREQAAYIGDGLPVAMWIGRLTGDWRYFKDMIIEQFRRQSPCGLVRSTLYSWRDDTLVDYNLIALLGLKDYLQITGDQQTVESVLPAARKVLGWFTQQLDENDGLLSWQWQAERPVSHREDQFEPDCPQITSMNLFIDHAGMGWHCIEDAGLDRHGTNAALHAFLGMALQAMVEIENTVGDPELAVAYQQRAEQLKIKANATFFNTAENAYVDGVHQGEPLKQISEQTNTLAILAGWCSHEQSQTILARLLQTNDPAIARNGYYFWLYTFEAMKRLDMLPLTIDKIRQLWQPVINAGASTVWETMAGDHLDSHCHPWSCVPASTLITDILGLGGLESQSPCVTPRCDLLEHAQGSMYTRHGKAYIQWQSTDDAVTLTGQLPDGLQAQLILPNAQPTVVIQGHWQHTINRSALCTA